MGDFVGCREGNGGAVFDGGGGGDGVGGPILHGGAVDVFAFMLALHQLAFLEGCRKVQE